jgi:hypothetical protein
MAAVSASNSGHQIHVPASGIQRSVAGVEHRMLTLDTGISKILLPSLKIEEWTCSSIFEPEA